VDDTIHYFAYFRFVVKTAGSLEDAMQLALLKVGRALIFTSIVLILGFLIFLFSETQILRDFGILSSIAVLTALFGDMFIGPVLLSKIPAFSSDLKTNKCNPESDDE
jgi:predicted RND superfamily exporter protein